MFVPTVHFRPSTDGGLPSYLGVTEVDRVPPIEGPYVPGSGRARAQVQLWTQDLTLKCVCLHCRAES